jgi:rubrerythrin
MSATWEGYQMFTLNDICSIAVQIEKNGERIYRAAGRKTDDPQTSQLFNWMADEEMHHAQWFKSLDLPSRVPPGHEEIESMGRSLLQEMMKDQAFSLEEERLLEVADLDRLFELSMEFEQDTILFYEALRSFIDDDDTVLQLNRVISEEDGHLHQLERLKGLYAGKEKGH